MADGRGEIFSVMLAGGSGTRFWPLSRKERPKQLLALAGDESMVRATQRRLEDLVPLERRLVITNDAQADAVTESLGELIDGANVLREPMGRDTSAAVVLGALAVAARDPDGVMAVLAADHVIEPRDKFRDAIAAAAEVAASSPTLVTLGIKPDHAATGYGYIHRGDATSAVSGHQFFAVESFREKPDRATAEQYVASGEYFWNSGIFIWSARTILDLAREFLPDIVAALEPLVRPGAPFPTADELRPAFEPLEKVSVDYGILERAPRVEMMEAPFSWDDVGAWTAIENHTPQDEDGNAVRGLAHLMKTKRTTVFTDDDHLVATLGVEDLVIVHSADATLVAKKGDVQEIKAIVEALGKRDLDRLL